MLCLRSLAQLASITKSWVNREAALHAHVFPRFATEPEEKRCKPVWFYDWKNAPQFDPKQHQQLMSKIAAAIKQHQKIM
jgi:hypothetical protein